MLARIHVLQALTKAWSIIAPSQANWLRLFEHENLPQGLAESWYAALCPGGSVKHVTFAEAYVHGKTPLPSVTFEVNASPARGNEQPMSANTRADQEVRFALKSAVTLHIHAATVGQADGLALAMLASLGLSGPWFTQVAGYRNPELDSMRELGPLPALQPNGLGVFRRQIVWSMARDHRYPPLLGSVGSKAYLSLHHYDAVDPWGNPGRVTTEE